MSLTDFRVVPVSMVDHQGRQRVELFVKSGACGHASLSVTDESGRPLAEKCDVPLSGGECHASVLLSAPGIDVQAVWVLTFGGETARFACLWKAPRRWTIHIMISSHTDIGLHNSQYIQRQNSERFLDQAAALCDRTADRAENDRYRYTIEGTWFFNNYPADRGAEKARALVENYIKPGKIGLCGGIAGNHTQVFGLEEMARATYGRRALLDQWGVKSETMTMIDNNGLSWGMVEPFCDAGFKNILFAPNQWNPLPSTLWRCDTTVPGFTWNCMAGGGGARIDMRLDGALPMVFFWQGADEKSRLLVFCGGMYGHCSSFGIPDNTHANAQTLAMMEQGTARSLPLIEEKYPFDEWISPCYFDDQEPSLELTDLLAMWNARWAWPRFRALGDPDRPLERIREKFGDAIPVLSGDVTGGWYQHPVSAPELLSRKFEADRLLPTAEKLASLAALTDENYRYPAETFNRAWDALLFNDEHSYGTSGYQGRRVYETWMQHRDWIDKALDTAKTEIDTAMAALCKAANAPENALFCFNPTLQTRTERIGDALIENIPPMGYKIALPEPAESAPEKPCVQPPVIENAYYRVGFAANGAIDSIYDKSLCRELIDEHTPFRAAEFVYTRDNHISFVTPERAAFTLRREKHAVTVTARMDEPVSGAAIELIVTLPDHEKRIELDMRLDHVRDLFNSDRYHRYAYCAFPFAVENARRVCRLNGCEAEYGRDVTGHGTDVYMAAHEWACAENAAFGAALIQADSELIEFDHIHPDKTDFGACGDGSAMYVYLANDWLQMHTSGGSALNFRFRYAITSYAGDHKAAHLSDMAERFLNPVITRAVECGDGTGERARSFLSADAPARLITLKRAEDGRGLIARLSGEGKQPALTLCGKAVSAQSQTADERDKPETGALTAFTTLRLCPDRAIKTRPIPDFSGRGAANVPVGASYTGLIDRPRAIRGEEDGMLYILWGRCEEKDHAYDLIYRSEVSGFDAESALPLARVERESYRVSRYIDRGLKKNTRYYYRVRAVDSAGHFGPLSEEFSALTRE